MIFGIILLAIAAILLVWFVAWFIITRGAPWKRLHTPLS